MNFKKIITLLLAFTLTLSLAACGSKGDGKGDGDAQGATAEEIYAQIQELADKEDVYKRQDERRLERDGRCEAEQVKHGKAAEDRDERGAEAVSYTHLDVYKRQVPPSLASHLSAASAHRPLR